MLGQRITGDGWNPTRSLELGAFGFLIDGPLRHLLSQMDRKSAAAELAGKVKSSVSSVTSKAWVPMLACVAIAALKAADGDPAALVHSCEVRPLFKVAARGGGAGAWCVHEVYVLRNCCACPSPTAPALLHFARHRATPT